MWQIILKYLGISATVVVAIGGVWIMGNVHGENSQRNSDSAVQLSLQQKYDAKLLVNTIAIQNVVESYSQTATSIALSNLKSKEDLSHDKKFINDHTIISTIFVRDSSPTSMSSTNTDTGKFKTEKNTLSESTTISNPWRISEWSIGITTDNWQCTAQLNALIDVVNIK